MCTCFLEEKENLQPFVQLHVIALQGTFIHVVTLFLCDLCCFCLFCYFLHRESASCTHVAALLHALSSLHPLAFNLKPNVHSAGEHADDEIPVTSLPCQWKPPKKRKQRAMRMSETVFQKHDYHKPEKRVIKPVED